MFLGFLELQWERLHLVVFLTLSLDLWDGEGAFNLEALALHELTASATYVSWNLLIFKVTVKSFDNDKNKTTVYMALKDKFNYKLCSTCLQKFPIYIWGLPSYYKNQIKSKSFSSGIKNTNGMITK